MPSIVVHLNVRLCASDPRPLYEHLKDSSLVENCRRFLELFPNLFSTISSGCDSSIEFLALACKFCPISDFVILSVIRISSSVNFTSVRLVIMAARAQFEFWRANFQSRTSVNNIQHVKSRQNVTNINLLHTNKK